MLSRNAPFLGLESLKRVSFQKNQIAHKAVWATTSRQADSIFFKHKDKNQPIQSELELNSEISKPHHRPICFQISRAIWQKKNKWPTDSATKS